MLEDVKEQFTLYKLKLFIFHRFSKLVSQTYPEMNPTAGAFLVQIIIQSILAVSILFQKGVENYWPTPEISTIANYCEYVDLSNLYTNELMDLVIQAIVIGLLLLFIIFFLIFIAGWMPKALNVFMTQFKRVLKLCTIPYFHVVAYNWFCKDCYDLHYITKPLLSCIFAIFFVIESLIIYFHFNPIPRKDNILVRLNSYYFLYTFWLNFLKVMIFQYRGYDLQFVAIVLFLDIGKIYYIRETEQNKIDYTIRIPDYISIITCSLIIFTQLNHTFAFGAFSMWIIGLILLLIQLVLKWFTSKGKSNSKVYDCLNAPERETLLMVQQFIRNQWAQLSSPELSSYITYIFFHINRCNDSKCYLRQCESSLRSINLNQLQEHSSEIKSIFLKFLLNLLNKHSITSEVICTQYIILCYHTHQSMESINISPAYSISQEYVRYMIEQRAASQDHSEDINITVQNYQQSKSTLLSQFNKIIVSLKVFLTELKVKKPSIDVLLTHGYNAHIQIEDLKKLFMRILRSDYFDLRIIEVYMEFMVNLLKQDELSDYISRVSKSKWLMSTNNLDILDSSIPSLHIDPDEDKIFNMNAEAIKILKFHRMDIYDKRVSNFLHPYDHTESLRSLFNGLIVKSKFCFIKDAMDNMLPVIITSKTKAGAKEVSIIEMECLNRLKEDVFVLIDNTRLFCEAYPQSITTSQGIKIVIKQFYNNILFGQIDQLLMAKFINIDYQGCYIHATLSETIHKEYSYIKITVKKHADNRSFERSIQEKKTKTIEFSHEILEHDKTKKQSIMLYGNLKEDEEEYSDDISVNILHLDTVVQGMITQYNINYAEGIKSYRLDYDVIYNIELEQDPEEKAEEIQEDRFTAQKEEDQHTRKKKIRFFYFCMFLLSLVYIVSHIVVNVNKISILKTQSTEHPLETIMIFETRFQRMFGILRDQMLSVKYTTTTNWTQQIYKSFNTIQKSEKMLKFSKNMISFPLLNVSYNSFLDYACNIFIAEIYRMSLTRNISNFLELNQVSMEYIDPAITMEKESLYDSLLKQLEGYFFYHIFIISVHVLIALLMLLFVVLINYQYRNEKQTIMFSWRSLSDEQIQGIIDKLALFEVQLMLSDRNQDVEVFDTLKETRVFQSREYPKEFSRRSDKRNVYWTIFIFFFLLLGGVIHGYSLYVASMESASIQNSLLVNKQLASTYIEIVKASKFNASISNDTVTNLNSISNDLQRLIPRLNYNSYTLSALNEVLFEEHCDFIKEIIPNVNCLTYSQGFLYPNPFMMGYLIDLSALTYQMVSNVTNLYISSGVIGYVYDIGVVSVLTMLMNAKAEMIRKFYTDQMGYAMTSIILCFLILIVILLVYTTSITGLKRIEQVSKLLNISVENKRGKKDNKKGKEYQELPNETKEDV